MKKLYAVIAQDARDDDFEVMEISFNLEDVKKMARWQKSLRVPSTKTILVAYPYEFQQDDDMRGLWDAAEDWYTYGEYEAVNF